MAKSSKRKSNDARTKAAQIEDAVTVDETEAIAPDNTQDIDAHSDAAQEAEPAPAEMDTTEINTADQPGEEFTQDLTTETVDTDHNIDDAANDPEVDADVDGENPDETLVSLADEAEDTGDTMTPEPHILPQPTGPGTPTLLLGGLVAGALGWGAAFIYPGFGASSAVTEQLEAQARQIAGLRTQLNEITVPDTSGLETALAGLNETVTQQSAMFSTVDERIATLERQPNADGTLSETALAAYRAELDNLRAELEEQRQDVMTAAEQAEADLAAARATSEQLEQNALAAAQAAQARAALNRIATAVDTGTPFAAALDDIGGIEVPQALAGSADTGVATNAELVDDFPAVARAALAAARSGGDAEDASGLSGFLRSQFNVRSTAPREGSDPDAILSRIEAATKEGRLNDALAELATLPDTARTEMTDWAGRVQTRADVLNALSSLSETYN